MSYLDYNATTPLRPEARAAMLAVLDGGAHNPSSVHAAGRAARTAVERARASVASGVGTRQAGDVVFTASGTEANNMLLRGLDVAYIVASAVEHDSLRKPLAAGVVRAQTHTAPVDASGVVDMAALERLLEALEGDVLLSVMWANNETGVIQPVAELAALKQRYPRLLLHTDAAQAVGRIPVDMAASGVDFLTVSAHKLGGPQGAAALVTGGCLPCAPLLWGGGQEKNRRAGTENVAAIAGFGAAVEAAVEHMEAETMRIQALCDAFEARLKAVAPEEVRIIGEDTPRLPNTTCVLTRGLPAETQLMALDMAGVAVSAGSACSSGKVGASHVLAAMGIPEADAACAIRISAGWETTEDDYARAFDAWQALYTRHRARCAA